MPRLIRPLIFAATLALASVCGFAAQAQLVGGVQQYGAVTPTDCVEWYANGLIEDSGAACGGGGGSGTVTSVSVATANGVSGTVANPTTTPAITISLGAITPSSVAIGAGSAITSSGPGGTLAAPAFAAFGTASGTVAQGGVITAGGPTGSATVAPIITYNAAGQLTTVNSATITPAVGSITGLGAGVATALGNTAGGSGGFALQSGLGSYLPLAGGTMTGTITHSDGGTWGSGGISDGVVAATTSLAVGGATLGSNVFAFLGNGGFVGTPSNSTPSLYSIASGVTINANPGSTFFLAQAADGAGVDVMVDAYQSGVGGSSAAFYMRGASGTSASPAALTTGQSMGRLNWAGWNTSFQFAAAIDARAAQNWGAGAQGTYIRFGTTPNNSTTSGEVIRIQASGGLSVGSSVLTTDPGAGGLVTSGNAVLGGTLTAASLSTSGTIAGSICATSAGLILYNVSQNCFAGGAVSSVANSDGTLTISPTTGSVVASLALSHANIWTGQQIFSSASGAGIAYVQSASGSTTVGAIEFSANNLNTGNDFMTMFSDTASATLNSTTNNSSTAGTTLLNMALSSVISTGTAASAGLLLGTRGTSAPVTIFQGGSTLGTSVAIKVVAPGNIQLPNITSDAAVTDSSLCWNATAGQIYYGSGTLGICLGTSSARYKNTFDGEQYGLEQIVALDPLTFHYNPGHGFDPAIKYHGFTAEDLVRIMPECAARDASGQPNSVDEFCMFPAMVNAIKQQQAEIASLQQRIH